MKQKKQQRTAKVVSNMASTQKCSTPFYMISTMSGVSVTACVGAIGAELLSAIGRMTGPT